MICDNCIHNAVCEREHFENHCGYKHTEADVIVPELEKIKEEFKEIESLRDNPYNNKTEYSVSMTELRELLDKHIAELKGIVDRIEEPVKKALSELKGENK